VRFSQDQSSFEFTLTEQANEFNAQFAKKLSRSEITKWVRGTARWTWTKFTQGKFQAGYTAKRTRLLDLPTSMSLRDRQRIGQDYTRQNRKVKTEDKIAWAIRTLDRDGCPVNKSSVARLSGLSRPTVIAHFDKVNGWVKQEYAREVKLVDHAIDELARERALSADVVDSVEMHPEDSVEWDVSLCPSSGFLRQRAG